MVFRSVRAVEAPAEAPAEADVSLCMDRGMFAAAETGEVVNCRGETGRGKAGRSGNRGREED